MRKSVVIAIAATGGIALAALGVLAGGALASAFDQRQDGVEAQPYQTNDSGQTYGSNIGSTSPETDPDLILVIGDHGVEGYVYSSELNTPAPASPAEAVAGQTPPGEVEAVLDVYAADGTTKVDTFTILGAEPATTS